MPRFASWCLAAVVTATLGCGSSSTPASPSPAPAPTAGGFIDLGRVLTATDFGVPAGTVIGDPTGIVLDDGRIRLFVYVEGRGVWRALSTDAQGTSFRVEGPCTLIPDTATNTMGTPWGEPRVTKIPGGLRMFYMQDRGIASATSTDHIIWRQEPGLRITAAQAGARATTTGSIVGLGGGRYRLYFSDLRSSPSDPATAMKSATSSDMLTWTMDPGVRIGPGAADLDQNATDPFVLPNRDGGVIAWYFVQPAAGSAFQGPAGLYAAVSADGLTFRTSVHTGIPGGNPDVVVRADGLRIMYLSATDAGSPGVRAVLLP